MGFLGLNAQYNVFTPMEDSYSTEDSPVQQVHGYVKTNSGWVRVNLKVRVSQFSVTVVGYKAKTNSGYDQYYNTYGGNQWKKCNARAEEVMAFSDGQYAANNFDYKANVPGVGIVYF